MELNILERETYVAGISKLCLVLLVEKWINLF